MSFSRGTHAGRRNTYSRRRRTVRGQRARPQSALEDFGVGLFGQAPSRSTIGSTRSRRADDYEDKSAVLENFFEPLLAPPASLEARQLLQRRAPASRRTGSARQDRYASWAAATRPAASILLPGGGESNGEEFSWNVEGVSDTMGGRTASANAALFYIDWDSCS